MSDTSENTTDQSSQVIFREDHIVAGLASADREFLCICLALFDASTVKEGIDKMASSLKDLMKKKLNEDQVAKIKQRTRVDIDRQYRQVSEIAAEWRNSNKSNDVLRLVLWGQIQQAYELAPSLASSVATLDIAASELVNKARFDATPSSSSLKGILSKFGQKKDRPEPPTLSEMLSATINELFKQTISQNSTALELDDETVADMESRLKALPPEQLEVFLSEMGISELSQSSLRKALLSSGGLITLSTATGISGFAPYILAAQASAFIPFMSGPVLVSILSVITNPLTVVALLGGGGWWMWKSLDKKGANIAAHHVIALLALQGLRVPIFGSKYALVKSFSRLSCCPEVLESLPKQFSPYKNELKILAVTENNEHAKYPNVNDDVFSITDYECSEQFTSKKDYNSSTVHIAMLTVGDLLYTASSVNTEVLEAVDFARAADLGDITSFAAWAQEITELSYSSRAGHIANIKGYVAEQMLASELINKGHLVEFPDTANQEGWDLLIDGVQVQVKCLSSISGLTKHLNNHPYPVIANEELVEEVGKLPNDLQERVFFVEGYSENLVSEITNQSMEAGASLLNPNTPGFAIAIIMLRQANQYRKGNVTADQAAEIIILEGGSRLALAFAGGKAGAVVGLMVFGPAGALILGPTGSVLSQFGSRRVQAYYPKSKEYKEWEANAQTAFVNISKGLRDKIVQKLVRFKNKKQTLSSGEIHTYFKLRITDQQRRLYEFHTRWIQLAKDPDIDFKLRSGLLLIHRSGIHPVVTQNEISQLAELIRDKPSRAGIGQMLKRDKSNSD